jgi:hypothetical protein
LRGPETLGFENETTKDVLIVIRYNQSTQFRADIELRRNLAAQMPGGKDLRDFCYFVARTPSTDFHLGWFFLVDCDVQEFVLKDEGGKLLLIDRSDQSNQEQKANLPTREPAI